ncbi:MAG TPA: lysophospholipid acyltransferase family protein [Phycisphaerae bacterium]|jgi:KDO2-lipid IV(A) lauroyltransferase|nr:lysophospholipid acyltransferase family protein [Phycisphaerae bacterium]
MAQNGAIVNFAQYLGARFTAMMLGMFPVNANLRTARAVGAVLYRIDRKHRKRALENLRASFPEKSQAELERIAQRSMQHFIELVMDVLFSTRLINVESWHRYVHLDGLSDSLRILLRGRGAIMLTGHYGNWEILGYTLATLGFETYSVARPIDNPLIDAWLLGVREKKGQVILSKRGVTTTALDVLQNKGVLGFIADQNAGPKGMFVPFFGRQASTYKSIGLLAIEHQVPVVVGYARRRGDRFEFDIGTQDIIYPEEWKNFPRDHYRDELHYITARYTKAIEDFVRDDPTQYLWIHRRWKTRPKGEAPGSVAGVG